MIELSRRSLLDLPVQVFGIRFIRGAEILAYGDVRDRVHGPLLGASSVILGRSVYRSFNVVSANSAKTSEPIQKRAITFDSDQPWSSK